MDKLCEGGELYWLHAVLFGDYTIICLVNRHVCY